MGAGIAHAFLINGANVVVVERDEASAEAARERVESAAAKSIERGAVDGNLDEIVSRLAVTVDYDDFAGRQLVVEAVPEDWDLKVTALRGIEERLADGAYLASNTSSLSVNGLARELKRPQNFLGLHFFNPVPASTLIEVVLGEQTSDALAQAARGWVEALGKTAVVVNDAPGFASSTAGRRDRPRSDAHGGRGRGHRRRHRQRHGAGLQAPHGTAADHRHRGPGRAPRHRGVPAVHAG